MKRPQKITLGEMRDTGVRGILIYCSDYKCSHSIAISADQWPDDVRIRSSGTGSAGAGASSNCEGAFGWRDVFHAATLGACRAPQRTKRDVFQMASRRLWEGRW